jgi:hypothetical protein
VTDPDRAQKNLISAAVLATKASYAVDEEDYVRARACAEVSRAFAELGHLTLAIEDA